MDGLRGDVRAAVRSLRRRAGLTALIVASLALGLGVTAAVFSVARAVLWSSLPVREPDRLVLLQWFGETWPRGLSHSGIGIAQVPGAAATSQSLPYPWFLQVRDSSPLLESVFAFAPLGAERHHVTLAAGGRIERIAGEMVSGNYFSGLGVAASAGRLLTLDDERTGARVTVISHELWRRRFSSEPAIAGRRVEINQVPFTIVGVAASGFLGLQPGSAPDLWVPVLEEPRLAPWGYPPAEGVTGAQRYWWAQVMARLRPGVDERRAAEALDGSFRRFVAAALPDADSDRLPHLAFVAGGGGLDRLRQLYERPLRLLLLMAGVVLVVASANVAVLLLARGIARRREFALRLSLGAPRARLVRQLLVETALTAAAGGLVGAIGAAWTSHAVVYLAPADRRPVLENTLDGGTFLFVGIAALFASLLAGLAPAFVATRVELMPLVRQPSSSAGQDPTAHRVWSSVFVVAQLALSLSLLVAAGLLIRSVINLQRQPIGIDYHRLLVLGADSSDVNRQGQGRADAHGRVLRAVAAVPGVEAVTTARLPLLEGWISTVRVAPGEEIEPTLSIQAHVVGPDFARTVGLPVLAGRDLAAGDLQPGRRGILLNEGAAVRLFGFAQAVGRTVSIAPSGERLSPREVVGIVGNMKDRDLRLPADTPAAFVPYSGAWESSPIIYYYVRAAGEPLALVEPVREAARRAAPGLAVFELETVASQVADSLWRERLIARLLSVFGILALALACIGLYGTMAHVVGRRRSEMAIRLALGARRAHVEWLVFRRALSLVGAGLATGLVIVAGGSGWIAPWLFGVTPADPATLAGSAGVLALVTLLAACVPSRHASRVDPAITLREE